MSVAVDQVLEAFSRLREDERGMTLSELMAAQLVAGVALAASAMLVVAALKSEQLVSDKVNSASQGRLVAAQVEQRLNSQLCLYPGEYTLNGATNGVGAASIVHAGSGRVIYFADISERPSGSTTGVGFLPYMRYLIAPTPAAGRTGGFFDAFRAPSTSTIPFNYSISPATSLVALAGTSTADTVPPTSSLRRIGAGVTNAVTGATSATVIPFFQYFDKDNLGSTGTPMAFNGSGAIPSANIATIAKIRVNFRILAQSGIDKTKQTATTQSINDRTETFSSDIFLRTTPNICDQFGS